MQWFKTGFVALCLMGSAMTQAAKTDFVVLGMGCFWGAEKRMSELPGVVDVESGYANGDIQGTYDGVLMLERARQLGVSKARNHAEVVKVSFDPAQVSLERVLAAFWENHDPTQGHRQGNDVGSNYRSAIYTRTQAQQQVALRTRDVYQSALNKAGKPRITTEIEPLQAYFKAEEYHQNYLIKNPDGYCGLGGTGVKYPLAQLSAAGSVKPTPGTAATAKPTLKSVPPLDGAQLSRGKQLVVYESEFCAYCKLFKKEVLDSWKSPVPFVRTEQVSAPKGWTLAKPVQATPTIVLFDQGKEVSRYTGYQSADLQRFWKWLGFAILTPEQQRIAFEQGTERPFTGSHLDEKRAGFYVDPITGKSLFRSDTKFDSGSGWPSFFNPVEGALTYHRDVSHGMVRVEVRSASSGIHLGHVFDDGPPPTGKRYCINGDVLKFVPD